jgi:hypothetical protein
MLQTFKDVLSWQASARPFQPEALATVDGISTCYSDVAKAETTVRKQRLSLDKWHLKMQRNPAGSMFIF